MLEIWSWSGAGPGFQVRGWGALKKIAPSGGRREHFGCISCEKSRFYAKKPIFFPILGGRAPVRPLPPASAPAVLRIGLATAIHILTNDNNNLHKFASSKKDHILPQK